MSELISISFKSDRNTITLMLLDDRKNLGLSVNENIHPIHDALSSYLFLRARGHNIDQTLYDKAFEVLLS